MISTQNIDNFNFENSLLMLISSPVICSGYDDDDDDDAIKIHIVNNFVFLVKVLWH